MLMNDKEIFRNKKNGKLYVKHGELIDCTNARDGTRVVAYSLMDEPSARFVRDIDEFELKFEKVAVPKSLK